jgi:hypothetical protein
MMIEDPEILRSYLLRELPEGEADAVERRLLADDAFFALAEAVEGDLVAACARGELPLEEQKKVLRWLSVSPRGKSRLAVAEGLVALAKGATATQAVRKAAVIPFPSSRRSAAASGFAALAASIRRMLEPQAPAFRLVAMACLALAVMAGGLRLVMQTARPGVTSENRASAAMRHATPPAAHSAPAALQPLVFQLATSFVRSGQEKRAVLSIPAGTKSVEIDLPLNAAEPYSRYRATLLDATTEAQVWQGELPLSSTAQGPMVVVSLPASRLPQGSYSLELHGLGADGSLEHVSSSPFDVHTTTH